jgi:MoaA/NifB/PqqE/SkfB family radical SAM enzyme
LEGGTKAVNKPIVLYIDINDGCNLNCIMCGTKHSPYSEQRVLDSQLFNENISPFFRHVCDFQLGCLYEPLLSPNFEEVVDSIANNIAPEVQGTLVSNGTLLNTRKIKTLIDSRIFKRLRFSIDAASSELYEKIRKGAKYAIFIKNIEKLVEYRNDNDKSVSVEFNFTIMPQNIRELSQLIKMASNIGIDLVTTHKLHPNDMGPVDEDYYDMITEHINQAKETAKKYKIKFLSQNYYTHNMLQKEKKQWKGQNVSKLCGFKDAPTLLRVDPLANVYTSCLRVPAKIGNMRMSSIDGLLKTKNYRYLLKCYQRSSHICLKCYMYRGNHVPDIDWS